LTNPTVQQMNRSINPFLNCGYCLIGSCAAQNRQQNAAQKRMDKETYAHWLDASWGDFRKQLLEAYPDVSRCKSKSEARSLERTERTSKISNISSQSSGEAEETGCAVFQLAVQRSETDLTADLPEDLSTEQLPQERPEERLQLVQIKTDDDGGDAASEGSRQTELAVEGQSCLRSGLEGLSYQEAHAIRNRLRLRLNAIHSNVGEWEGTAHSCGISRLDQAFGGGNERVPEPSRRFYWPQIC